jgi:hypothetical protein
VHPGSPLFHLVQAVAAICTGQHNLSRPSRWWFGFDSLSATKRQVLSALIAGTRPQASELRLPPSTFTYAVSDLHCLRLTIQEWKPVEHRRYAVLTENAQRLFRQAGLHVKGVWAGGAINSRLLGFDGGLITPDCGIARGERIMRRCIPVGVYFQSSEGQNVNSG